MEPCIINMAIIIIIYLSWGGQNLKSATTDHLQVGHNICDMLLVQLKLCQSATRYQGLLHHQCNKPKWTTCPFIYTTASIQCPKSTPQWGAADTEIKVPSDENTELKGSLFKAWSRSVYSHTCYAYCQGVLPCLFLPFRSIHLHFFKNLSRFFLCWLRLRHGSCVGPQNKIGHPARGRFQCWVLVAYK